MLKRTLLKTATVAAIGLSMAPLARAACSGDAVNGFDCSLNDGTVAIGAVFTSDSGARKNVSLALVEELLEEEAEETGGGAGDGPPVDVYVNLAYGDRSYDAVSVPGFDSETWGLVLGATFRGQRHFFGAAVDYSDEDADVDANASGDDGSRENREIGLQVYGTYYPAANDNLFLSAAGRIAWSDIDTERTFDVDPSGATVLTTAKGSTDGLTYGLLGGVGYAWPIQDGTVLSLSGWLSWQRHEIDGYTERGSAPPTISSLTGNLRFADDEYSTFDGILTASVIRAIPITNGRLIPSVSLSYLHEFESDTRDVDAEVAESSDPTRFIVVRTNPADKNYFRVGVSVTAELNQGTTLFAGYTGVAGHDWREENLFTVGFSQAF